MSVKMVSEKTKRSSQSFDAGINFSLVSKPLCTPFFGVDPKTWGWSQEKKHVAGHSHVAARSTKVKLSQAQSG